MKPYLLVGLFIFPLLVGVYLISFFSPDASLAPTPYSSSIIAFEFATNYNELKQVFDPLSQQEISNLDKVNFVDFGFMICYSLFLFCFLFVSKKIDAQHLFRLGSIIIGVIYLSDVIETLTLLNISNLYQNQALATEFETSLTVLYYSTWLKWSFLAICLGIFGYILIKRKQIVSIVFGILLMIPLLLCGAGFFGGQQLKDIFATSIFGGFACLLLYCLMYKSNIPSKHS